METSDIHILVVDDEAVVNINLSGYLEDEGFTVFSAASAEEALELIDQQRIDVGIIDMRLPGMDGNALILKAYHKQRAMKFLIHTGSTNYSLPQSLIELGLGEAQVLRKPVSDLSILPRMIYEMFSMDDNK
ncbi:MAG: response regulator [Desulfobacterales bacterium]|nr:response regulator [Desulfobacterales bacterium]